MEAKCSLACEYLSKEDYMDLLWTTLSEFPGEAGAGKPIICLGLKKKKKKAGPEIFFQLFDTHYKLW